MASKLQLTASLYSLSIDYPSKTGMQDVNSIVGINFCRFYICVNAEYALRLGGHR